MFIEQIIEIQLGGWAPWPYVNFYNWLFLWQNKENFWVDYWKYWRRQCTFENIEGGNVPHFTLPGPNHLQILQQDITF